MNNTNLNVLKSSSQIDTKIDIKSNTTFDVTGDYFKIRLLDESGNAISNVPVSFIISGTTYNRNTDGNGLAAL